LTISSNTGAEEPKVVRTEPWLLGPTLKVSVENPGSHETLRLMQDGITDTELHPMEVEIEAKAWGLGLRDVFIALGRLEEDGSGMDCAGVVTRVGEECSTVQPGDRVCMAAIGCMRMFPRAHQASIAKIPDHVPFTDACAAVSPAVTAWWALADVARIQQGGKVPIHAASGATGQLAVQIAKHFGAEIFATVGHHHKKQLLVDSYGMPEDHIFYSRNTSFAESVCRLTNGYGVDIVLNSLVSEGMHASWECIAPYGRFVEIGKADIHADTQLPMAHVAKNVAFAAVGIRDVLLHRSDIVTGLMANTRGLATEGILPESSKIDMNEYTFLTPLHILL
jgi:NADPH:quinone reductase-like Zn-dependent oxidoreductase